MKTANYSPFTAEEAAHVLGITDCEELNGADIAKDMLDGRIRLTKLELKKLADYKRISVDEMLELDAQFKRYVHSVITVRKEIAVNLLNTGCEVELAAKVCGLSEKVVYSLHNYIFPDKVCSNQ